MNVKKPFCWMLLLALVSCRDEPQGPDCSDLQVGHMYVKFSEIPGQEVDYNFVVFVVPEDRDTIIDVDFRLYTNFCEWRVAHGAYVKKDFSKQELVKREWVNGVRLIGSTSFQTLDHDATTEGFDLYDGEPAWLQFTELGTDRVKGRLQATYVYRPGYARSWNLPDTLRFHNIAFTAELLTDDLYDW